MEGHVLKFYRRLIEGFTYNIKHIFPVLENIFYMK